VEDPNYVFKTVGGTNVPGKNAKTMKGFRIVVLSVVVVIIAGSLLSGENLFLEMSMGARSCLFFAIIVSIFHVTDVEIPTPVEFRFFDDYLIVYQEHASNASIYNQIEIYQMKYSDITKCQIMINRHQLEIYANNLKQTFYKYKSDGTVEEKPKEDEVYDSGVVFSRIPLSDDDDYKEKLDEDIKKIKTEIENHSPIKVNVF